ncbi:hypothetical protein NPIL_329371 [Nephila pilipes]|uniref:Uncharacterized protein n=1 Tax=Nephila pilipes TaxID=299642 RepID=A0A8X6QGN1_NEPPI|nr:hypothetical protein NPIL_329371 [Nephila pilipes]
MGHFFGSRQYLNAFSRKENNGNGQLYSEHSVLRVACVKFYGYDEKRHGTLYVTAMLLALRYCGPCTAGHIIYFANGWFSCHRCTFGLKGTCATKGFIFACHYMYGQAKRRPASQQKAALSYAN